MGRTDAVSYDFPEMGDLLSFDNTRRLSSLRDTARAATRQGGVGPRPFYMLSAGCLQP